ncbi:MAG: site-specific integrase [Bryobacteraceae bacterium]
MSLYKRGRKWWTNFYVDGVRHEESTGTGNERQAQIIERKLIAEANARRFDILEADPTANFAEVSAKFLASGAARPHHAYHLKFLLPFFGETVAYRITKSQAAEFRKARHQGNPKIKDASINRDLSVLRRILDWAQDERLIPANPIARIKLERERRTRRQVLSLDEEEKLLATAAPHLREMAVAALDTGMRRGEITGQLWEDVDLHRRLLYVTRSKTPEGEAREIPLTARLFELLAGKSPRDNVVFAYEEAPVRIIKRSWKSALRRAGLRHIRFHDLRHSFNTRLMEAGVMQEVRMALMGHSSGNKVHSTYTHVELPVKREAIARLEEWVVSQRKLIGGNYAPTQK